MGNAPAYITEAERAEARADYLALGWPHDVIARELAALGPTAEEAGQLPACETGPRRCLPFDVLIPPSWRDPAKMRVAVESAVAALHANPKASQRPRLTIFQAISRTTSQDRPLSPDTLKALAVGLGIAAKVNRRDEARKVRSATSRGFVPSETAGYIGRHPRTARRRKYEICLAREWPDAAAVVANIEMLAAVRESAKAGGWDQSACLTLYDACSWFAGRARPIPPPIWWAIAVAFGLAVGVHAGGRFTDDAVEALWGSPTPRPAIADEAARLVVRADVMGEPRPSNRQIARTLGVGAAVIDRLTASDEWQRLCQALRITARQNVRSSLSSSDPDRMVNIAGELMPASSVRKSVRFP